MSETPITLRLRAGEGALVRLLGAMRNGRAEFVGMRLDDDAKGWVPSGEVTAITVAGDHATSDLAAYRKDALAGHVVPDDEATALALGVPFRAPPAPEPAAPAAPDDERPSVQVPEAAALESPPGPPPPAEGQGRAFLGSERPGDPVLAGPADADAFDVPADTKKGRR
jgi:hypothetical protein